MPESVWVALKRLEDGNFFSAWGGISSLQLGLPVVWTASRQRGYSICDIVEWMSRQPAKLAGLDRQKGSIRVGQDADLVVFDPEASFDVQAASLYTRHTLTPYLGETLFGAVETTFVRGRKVCGGGRFFGTPEGRRCLRQ